MLHVEGPVPPRPLDFAAASKLASPNGLGQTLLAKTRWSRQGSRQGRMRTIGRNGFLWERLEGPENPHGQTESFLPYPESLDILPPSLESP